MVLAFLIVSASAPPAIKAASMRVALVLTPTKAFTRALISC
jgi:hypothetical protein